MGKAGSAGTERGVTPILRDGVVVATLRASGWKEAATARIGDREWIFAKSRGALTARWSEDPEDTARMRARQTSFWKSTWVAELDGRPVEVTSTSMWKSTHRFASGGVLIAESGSTGGWGPRPTLSAEDSLPLHQQVFLLWMELVLQRRHNAAAGAATGVAVFGSGS
nr:hypothetical protein [Blastococcus saxobsidens]